MKILHICTGWPLSFKGGITNYVKSLAQSQFNAGYDVSVLGAPDKESYEFKYITYNSNVESFSFGPIIDKKGLLFLENILNQEKYDIIHIHAIEKVDWDFYQIIKRYHYVVSLHDYYFICPRIYMYSINNTVCTSYKEKECQNCISYLERYRLFRAGYNKINNLFPGKIKIPRIKQTTTKTRYSKYIELLNGADYILPVSKKVEEIYKNSGVTTRSKVLHIGNVSADLYSESYTYNEKPHVIKIVFLGRLTNYKGANLFIRIAKELENRKEVQFHFLGRAGEYVNQLKEANIIDHGAYDQTQLSSILCEFDMGMVLSIWHDNGPQVVMELLNNHIPVIGTNMGGIPDFVNYENGYIFDPFSEKSIEEAIVFIRELTPSKIARMKKMIKRTTTTNEHNNDVLTIYNEVLSKQ